MSTLSTFPVDIHQYYSLEWKLKCPQSASFLASWQGLALYSHLMLIILLPVYTFTTYCILKKTPRTMSSVKWVLLNTHFWSCYIDILMCSLITPYFYFPTISGFPVGLMRFLGVSTSSQTFLGLISAMFMGNSLTALFENRSSCIPSNKFRITRKSTRIIYYSINCWIVVLYLIPPFINIPDQESARLMLLKDIPCPTEEFFTSSVFVFAVDPFWKTYLWAATGIMVLFIMLQISFFSGCCTFYLFLSTQLMISPKTKKYQRSFFLGTLAQVIVPLIFLAIPVACGISSIYWDYYNQELNNSIVIMFSAHGLVADLVILMIHHPYRHFLRAILTCSVQNEIKVSTGISFVTNYERATMRKLSTRALM